MKWTDDSDDEHEECRVYISHQEDDLAELRTEVESLTKPGCTWKSVVFGYQSCDGFTNVHPAASAYKFCPYCGGSMTIAKEPS